MKKTTILLVLMLTTAYLYSQSYIISFAANGAVMAYDSVKVENLTQSTVARCYTGDVLELRLNAGINEINANKGNILISPNPMTGFAEISFYAQQQGVAKVSIYDISGKAVLNYEKTLLKGSHHYSLTGLKQGVYLINISGNEYQYSAKILSQSSVNGTAQLKYAGMNKQEVAIGNHKSAKAIVSMNYTAGDNLRFTGYSDSLTAIVNDVPTGNKTITFTFVNIICGQIYTDLRDSNDYPTIQIGNQCWMTKNLAYLPKLSDGGQGSTTIPYYHVYNYLDTVLHDARATANYITYGVLYNWKAALAGSDTSSANPSGVQGICPAGWHLPSYSEWNQLLNYLGNDAFVGGKMKEAGTTHWLSPNTGGTNSSGFSALPGGVRLNGGGFTNMGEACRFWSTSTFNGPSNATTMGLYYADSDNHMGDIAKEVEVSVRCVKD